jgi:hypothetical protein
MSDMQDEKTIQAAGKTTAPRILPEQIEATIVGETYTVLPSGRVTVCELALVNGFTVRGESSVVSIENFDAEIGRAFSRKKAVDQIWPLEAYLLKQRLYEDGLRKR